jgi:hypothetical protein
MDGHLEVCSGAKSGKHAGITRGRHLKKDRLK